MAMINFGLGFFGKHWKEIAVGVIIAALTFITISWWNQSIEMGRLKTQLTMASQQNETLQSKVSAFEKAEDQAQQSIVAADKNRVLIITSLQKEINKIRTQAIPKDCQGALAYGIQYKDDLKWPEQQPH